MPVVISFTKCKLIAVKDISARGFSDSVFYYTTIFFLTRYQARILFCGRSTNFFIWLPVVLKSKFHIRNLTVEGARA